MGKKQAKKVKFNQLSVDSPSASSQSLKARPPTPYALRANKKTPVRKHWQLPEEVFSGWLTPSVKEGGPRYNFRRSTRFSVANVIPEDKDDSELAMQLGNSSSVPDVEMKCKDESISEKEAGKENENVIEQSASSKQDEVTVSFQDVLNDSPDTEESLKTGCFDNCGDQTLTQKVAEHSSETESTAPGTEMLEGDKPALDISDNQEIPSSDYVEHSNDLGSVTHNDMQESASTPDMRQSDEDLPQIAMDQNDNVPTTASNRKVVAKKIPILSAKKVGFMHDVGVTPNFKVIHQKAFSKMESICDSVKKKAAMKQKILRSQSAFKPSNFNKKVAETVSERNVKNMKALKKESEFSRKNRKPFMDTKGKGSALANFKFGNPSVLKAKSIPEVKKSTTVGNAENVAKSDCSVVPTKKSCYSKYNTRKPPKDSVSGFKACKENRVNKAKFDLQASLKRKLTYKPYTGALKPFCESVNKTFQ